MNFIKSLLVIVSLVISVTAVGQSLGHYSPTTIAAGGNVVVTPSNAPSNTNWIQVYTSSNFLGILTAKPATGVVNIVNAKPVGTYTITVRAFSSSGSSSIRTFQLTVGKPRCSVGNFVDSNEINTGLQQINVAVGDFNRDGKQDIAAAHEGGNNTVSIRLGNGHGDFSGTTEVSVGSHPYNLVVGDFNRDGKQDLAVSCQGAHMVSICLGDGSGGFSNTSFHNVGNQPIGIALGDFNEDGKQDFATSNLNSHSVSIRIGNGLGTFSGHTEVAVDSFPYAIVVGDFNTDHHQDFATVSGSMERIAIRFGDGTGHFSGNTFIPVGSFPYGLTIGDFNEDGNQDLVSSNFVSNTLSVRLGDGLGGFSGNTEVPVGDGAYSVTAGNLNGDEHLDLTSVNYFNNTVSIKLGDGQGNFSGNTVIGTGSYPITIAVGEFNNDRKPDIIVSNYNDHSVSILLGVVGVPPVASVSSNSPICVGQDLQLFSDGDSTYSWVGPHGYNSTLQNPVIATADSINSGLYTVTVTNSSNCSAVTSTYVNVYPNPRVSLSLSPDSLCYGSSVQTLSGGSPSNGTLSGTGVLTGNEFSTTVSGPGNFVLNYTYTDNHGCTNSANDDISVIICNDVSEEEYKLVSVYPNPVIDNFNLTLPKGVEKFDLKLFSQDGKLVRSWNDQINAQINYSTNGLSDGFYFLKIKMMDRLMNLPIVILTQSQTK